jgi:hypothetical protein
VSLLLHGDDELVAFEQSKYRSRLTPRQYEVKPRSGVVAHDILSYPRYQEFKFGSRNKKANFAQLASRAYLEKP